MPTASWVALGLQGVLASVFLIAGIYKIDGGPGTTAAALNAVNWVPTRLTPAAAGAIPWIEVALACWIVSGLFPRAAAVACVVAVIGFSIHLLALGQAIGWRADCGCTGPFTKLTVVGGLVRNGIMLTAAIALLCLLRARAARAHTHVIPAVS